MIAFHCKQGRFDTYFESIILFVAIHAKFLFGFTYDDMNITNTKQNIRLMTQHLFHELRCNEPEIL